MVFESFDQVVAYIKANESLSPYIQTSREQTNKLRALIDGTMFSDLLVRIEDVESTTKALARKKHSRSIKDLFDRLYRPIDNIYHSTGGSTVFLNDSKSILSKRLEDIRHV